MIYFTLFLQFLITLDSLKVIVEIWKQGDIATEKVQWGKWHKQSDGQTANTLQPDYQNHFILTQKHRAVSTP